MFLPLLGLRLLNKNAGICRGLSVDVKVLCVLAGRYCGCRLPAPWHLLFVYTNGLVGESPIPSQPKRTCYIHRISCVVCVVPVFRTLHHSETPPISSQGKRYIVHATDKAAVRGQQQILAKNTPYCCQQSLKILLSMLLRYELV